jgi:hypothetical protein
MEIYVDDEAKLTLHGLVQVSFVLLQSFRHPLISLSINSSHLAAALHKTDRGREEPEIE